MESRIINVELIKQYEQYLINEEKSLATIEKYLRDINKFMLFLPADKTVNKEIVKVYKQELLEKYKPASINSMLVAINQLFKYLGWYECVIKELKIQKRIFLDESKELTKIEYLRLVKTAKHQNKERLALLIQAICATGIRVSEHKYITVAAVKQGYGQIYNKGKIREIFFSNALKKIILQYCRLNKISEGPVFKTKNGKPLDRSNIWKEMKQLCHDARVAESKVFPHNLRHLFAVTYYGIKKDLARLADLLGHSSVDTTRIYTMTSSKMCRKHFNQMNLILNE